MKNSLQYKTRTDERSAMLGFQAAGFVPNCCKSLIKHTNTNKHNEFNYCLMCGLPLSELHLIARIVLLNANLLVCKIKSVSFAGNGYNFRALDHP